MKFFRRKKKKSLLIVDECCIGFRLRAATDSIILTLELSNGSSTTYDISWKIFNDIVNTADIFR